jgi:signal transduction histidine kinase
MGSNASSTRPTPGTYPNRKLRALHSTANPLDLPLPSRNFTAIRHILLVVLAASIVIPLVCLLGYGYYDYQRRMADSNDVVDRLARVAQEQAVKVMDLNSEMAARGLELLGDSDDTQVSAQQAHIHRRLGAIGGDYPQVAAMSVFGVNVDLLASSRAFPVPRLSVAQREDFLSARAVRPQTYFSLPMRGKVAQTDVFNTAAARVSPDGRFLGMISIALRQQYFADFYRELASSTPGLSIGLYRQDASVLARYPGRALGAKPVRPIANTAFSRSLRDNMLFGHVRISSATDDSEHRERDERLLAFRRVGDYPLYVAAGYSVATVFGQWWRHYLFIVAATGVPCVAVWLLVLFSLRQLKAEQLAWERWQSEVAMRVSAEASTRQLQRMGALGNLVANIAHDFNNLLMVVSANMALAHNKGFNNLEKEVRAVEHATAGAESLARRLLSVTRKQPLQLKPIDLSTWLPATADLIRTAVGDKVELALEVMPDIWQILADATELESAIINAAVNARDAMPNGGRFAVRCRNIRSATRDMTLVNGEYVQVALSDDGAGMAAAIAQRAFEPFFSTKTQGSGVGLGLPQVLAACEQAGGTARIDTVPGKGTTVRLYLPRYLDKQPAAAPQEASAARANDTLPASVLLIEDNEEVAAGVVGVLEVFGCEVRHEATADKAIEILDAGHTFNLVLSDVQLPGKLSGIDLAERVRSTWPAQRIALMTGYADELERAQHTGVTILAKPFDIDALHALVTDSARR